MGRDPSRQKEYNCRRCRKNGKDKTRNCFWFNGEAQDVVPTFDIKDESGNFIVKTGDALSQITAEELVEYLTLVTDQHPTMSMFDAVKTVFSKVCAKSLLNEEIEMLITMESFCRDYGLRPLGDEVGYLDYPAIFVETFGTIATARERITMKEMQEMKSSK